MSTPDLKPILDALASGRIDAAEAARRIDALKKGVPYATAEPATPTGPIVEEPVENAFIESSQPEPEQPSASGPSTSSVPVGQQTVVTAEPVDEVPPSARRAPFQSRGIERLSVHAVGRRVRIVGDHSVTTVAAEGPHVLRRDGATLEVSSDGEIGPSLDGFSMLRPPRSLDDVRAMSLGKELFLRVNPGIIVDVEVTAGSLTTEKVPYLGKVRVTAGGATMSGVAEISDALVQAGTANIKGSVRTGRSRIRVESGNLNLGLDSQSNVTVRGEAQLGRVHWVGQPSGMDEMVLGNGSARLDVGVVMGNANIDLGPAQ